MHNVRLLPLCLAMACVATAPTERDAAPVAAAAAPVQFSPPLDGLAGAPILGRLIGLAHEDAYLCPDIGLPGWSMGEPLFGDADDFLHSLPPGLSRFCLYTQTDGPLVQADIEQAVAVASMYLSDVSADRPVVAPMAPSLEEAFAESHLAATQLYAGHPEDWGVAPSRRVQLQLLDTHPDVDAGSKPWAVEGTQHGLGLSALARDLVCDDGDLCAVEVGTATAMPLVWDGLDTVKWAWDEGGEFGSLGVLAQTLRDTVSRWQEDEPDAPLVLNLSLAWHPDYGGFFGPPDSWPVDAQAVYAALVDAQCRGAVTFAAVGNATGGVGTNKGAMLPAAWGDRLVDAATCDAAVPADQIAGHGLGEPLLYPVGGLDMYGDHLATSRPKSRPALLAFADHATSVDMMGEILPPLTGTSVATTVVASAVASTLAFRPDLQPHEAVDLVLESGQYVGSTSQTWGQPIGYKAFEVRACQAVFHACTVRGGGPGCAPHQAPVCDESHVFLDAKKDDLAAWDADAEFAVLWSYGPFDVAACDAGDVYGPSAHLPEDPCPESQYFDITAAPFSGPQPGTEQCQTCDIERHSGLVRLESSRPFAQHLHPVIRLRFSDGRTIDHALGQLPQSQKLLRKVDPSVFEGLVSATYSARIDGVRYTSALQVRD